MWFLLLLFFLSPILFVVTGTNMNNFIYLLLLVCTVAYSWYSERKKMKFSVNFLFVLGSYCLVVGFAMVLGFFRGLQVAIIFKEALYYFKPVLFLFFGLFFLNEKRFRHLIFWGFLVVAFGAIVFYNDPAFYIGKAIEKTPEAEGVGHFYAIHHTVLRNSSLLLSPLETGYTLFFIASYFLIFYDGKWRWFLLVTSVALLAATWTRSVVIGFLLTFLTYRLVNARTVKKLYVLIAFGLVITVATIAYYDDLHLILIEDASATSHFRSLTGGIDVILKRPWGYGMGFSGFGSLLSTEETFYSEGSFFTSIIEAGVLFVFFYWCVYYYLNRVSKRKFLPVYVGFLAASMLIPIGFSTIFAALFFSYLGIIIKNDLPGPENSYHTH